MKGIRLTVDIEEGERPDDLPAELRGTYEKFDTLDPERRRDVADCVTAAVGAAPGAFGYNGDVSDLFKWPCENGYVSVAAEEDPEGGAE